MFSSVTHSYMRYNLHELHDQLMPSDSVLSCFRRLAFRLPFGQAAVGLSLWLLYVSSHAIRMFGIAARAVGHFCREVQIVFKCVYRMRLANVHICVIQTSSRMLYDFNRHALM